jgi:alpha-beta hydrolase superfamily lysophospholipase
MLDFGFWIEKSRLKKVFRRFFWSLQRRIGLLILHGRAEQVVLPEGGYIFFQQVTILDKERREYPGVYHEIHNDFNYQEMLADLDNWLEQHLPRNAE